MRVLLTTVILFLFCASTRVPAEPIHDAVKAGDIEQVRHLIDLGANVNADGFLTPLHWQPGMDTWKLQNYYIT